MGQPIYLQRENEKMTVYGMSQARVHIAQGWRMADPEKANAAGKVDDLTAIYGVGEWLAGVLANAGFDTYQKINDAPTDKLVALNGISPLSVGKIQKNVAELLKGNV